MRSLRHREINWEKKNPDVSVEGENGDYATESQRNTVADTQGQQIEYLGN